jgi:deoxycytidine triphosphate deaminase
MLESGSIFSEASSGVQEEDIQPSTLDLTTSEKSGRFTLAPGKSVVVPLNEGLRLPRDNHVKFDTRSTFAKAGIQTFVTGEGGEVVRPGYDGRLHLTLRSGYFHTVVVPNVSIAQARFFHGDPRECVVRAQDALNGQGQIGDIENDMLVMHLNLRGNGKDIGYESLDSECYLHLYPRVNDKASFWKDVSVCENMEIQPGRLYLFLTKEKLHVRSNGEHSVAEMPRTIPGGNLKINGAALIEYESGPEEQALEIMPDEKRTLTDGEPICHIRFYRLLDKPEKVYAGKNGYRNLDRLMGYLFKM